MPLFMAPSYGDFIDDARSNPMWPNFSDKWLHGLASQIHPPARGAWTPPEALSKISNNLIVMTKRLENMVRATP